jgi:hypothetical protein
MQLIRQNGPLGGGYCATDILERVAHLLIHSAKVPEKRKGPADSRMSRWGLVARPIWIFVQLPTSTN